MTIKAVVFDIGGVLEIIDDSIFPGSWPARLGLTEAEFAERLGGLAGDPVVASGTTASRTSSTTWSTRTRSA